MTQDRSTWILVVDSRQARFFEERWQGGVVHELADLRLNLDTCDLVHGSHPTSTLHERAGRGRHAAGGRDIARECSRRFLRRVVDRADVGVRENRIDRLVVIAPPRTLGVIRAELPPGLSRRLAATDPHDRILDAERDIRLRLQALRRATGAAA